MKDKYCDHCHKALETAFVDGRSKGGSPYHGQWGNFCLECWQVYGIGQLGTGLGQLYQNVNGEWVKGD